MTTRTPDRSTRRRTILVLAIAAMVVCLAAGSTMAQGYGRCAVAEVPSTIVLPDDTIHPAGTLKVCLNRLYSPVAGLHVTYVNGRSVGMFVSRLDESEAREGAAQPFFVFGRNRSGQLVLEAYAWPDADRFYVYHVRESVPLADTLRADLADLPAEPESREINEPIVLVAARH